MTQAVMDKVDLSYKGDVFSYNQLVNALKKLNEIKGFETMVYVSGGLAPYLYLNTPSTRLHEDLDLVCDKFDIETLREMIKKAKLYIPEWDSLSYENDGEDYGFSFLVDGVPVGIFPYEKKIDGIKQNSFDPFTREVKSKVYPGLNKSDYITIYKRDKQDDIRLMSLEVVTVSKYLSNRNKDRIDFAFLAKCNLDREKFDRVKNAFASLRNDLSKYNSIKVLTMAMKNPIKLKQQKQGGYASVITIISSVSLIVVALVIYMFNR